jgi:hypothetical protein
MFDRWCILKLAILAPARLRAKLLTHCYPESQEIFNPSIRVHVFLLLIGFFWGGRGFWVGIQGLTPYQADALPIEPHLQPMFLLFYDLRRVLVEMSVQFLPE